MERNSANGRRNSADDRNGDPLELLKKEHEEVRGLFSCYLDTDDIEVKREAARSVLAMLEMHSVMEEAAFYPFIREADAQLVEHCEGEHEEADRLVRQLKEMDVEDPLYEATFQQLREAVMHHVETEEKRLFPELRQSDIDMEQLGLEMQAFESTMIGLQPRSGATGARA